jgi:hypothetical protein
MWFSKFCTNPNIFTSSGFVRTMRMRPQKNSTQRFEGTPFFQKNSIPLLRNLDKWFEWSLPLSIRRHLMTIAETCLEVEFVTFTAPSLPLYYRDFLVNSVLSGYREAGGDFWKVYSIWNPSIPSASWRTERHNLRVKAQFRFLFCLVHPRFLDTDAQIGIPRDSSHSTRSFPTPSRKWTPLTDLNPLISLMRNHAFLWIGQDLKMLGSAAIASVRNKEINQSFIASSDSQICMHLGTH